MGVAYSFYIGTYYGNKISEGDFPRLSARATSYLGSIGVTEIGTDAAKMAVCAVAEAWQEKEQGGELSAQSVGGWSKSYVRDTKPKDKLFEAAALYLVDKVSKVRWA